MKALLTTLVCFFYAVSFAQQPSTTSSEIEKALTAKNAKHESSIVKNVPFKNIGPTIMSGRIVDLAINENNPNEFYAAYASGGLWHTTNNGNTFTPILDTSETQNIGDIAVDWKTGTIWVGTGENNASRSSYAGIGILKSSDNGKTWTNVGLKDSHHIGRILINPNNADEVIVGVTGHLYSPSKERGIYKTTDGGKTWKQTLFVNETTGIIDVAVAPDNFQVMYAAAWEKDRKAWNFKGNGSASGVYKSIDGGNTWKLITKSGLPEGEGVGRIGLAVYNENTAYIIHDSQFRREKSKEPKNQNGLTKEDFKQMSVETFLGLSDKKLNTFLKINGFQEKYRAENVKQLIRSGEAKPIDIAKYLEDANAMLFDSPVVSAEVYRTDDAGKTWKKTHKEYLEDVFYSYGYYFCQIRVHPKNKDKIYVGGVPIIKSDDGGKTFVSINKENVHVDHHALWISPKLDGHLINGNDGGVNISYDDGESWVKCNSPSVGQFYAINVDNEEPYNVYGGLQDNGVWVGPSNHKEDKSWFQQGKYPYESIMGGDGMQIMIDNRNSKLIYTGYQFGNYYRIDRSNNERKYIQPKHNLGESPYRFNWQTPILLSTHNQDILYLGGNKLMRSMNKGDDWTAISEDLTNGGKKGNVAYGTLTSIDESPFQFGLMYTGSDDGLVHVTKDGGATWKKISNTFPKDLWVSRVIASKHKKSRVYVALNGYRWDDFTAYIYKSDDYGVTWKKISSDIPSSPVNVIREDLNDENILYAGTDNGAYVSFNSGNTWEVFSKGIPNVAVHDLVIQEKTNDLLVGTHGRSIYKTNVAAFQQYDVVKGKELFVFNIANIKHSRQWGNTWSKWLKPYVPEQNILYYANNAADVKIQVLSEKGNVLNEFSVKADKGFNYFNYDFSVTEKGRKALIKEDKDLLVSKKKNGRYYLPVGKYTVQVVKGKLKETTSLTIE